MKDVAKEKIGKIMLSVFGLKTALKIYFRLKTKMKLNLDNPKRYSEKIQLRKLNYNNPLYILCADKYKVREYIKEKIGDEYLIPLYFAKKEITKEDLEKLPNQFVLKTNNASKTNIIVNDKEKINIDDVVKKMNKFIKYKFGYRTFELFYNEIDPLIIAEKYIGTENQVPNDYKFHCFKQLNGRIKVFVQVDVGRFSDNHCMAYFDEMWNMQPFGIDERKRNVKFNKPKNLKKMLEISKKLSEDFDYVRVDLYEVERKIYFGELTFTDGSGYDILQPDKYDVEWGTYWK